MARATMNRVSGVFITALCLLGFSPVPVFSEDKTPARLEREYEQESNPKKRVKLAIQLMEGRLKQLRSAFENEASPQQGEAVENYLAAVNRVAKAVTQASNIGASKNAETRLRQQSRELENLKVNASYLDRPPLEKVLARVTKLREEILYSIMNPRKESAKQ